LFTLTTSRLQSQNSRCQKNKSIEERVARRTESKKEVENTLPVIWWSCKIGSLEHHATGSIVVNWFVKRLMCKRLEIFLLRDELDA
jgi:hypothetical protein